VGEALAGLCSIAAGVPKKREKQVVENKTSTIS
jgi:hypothetical protein